MKPKDIVLIRKAKPSYDLEVIAEVEEIQGGVFTFSKAIIKDFQGNWKRIDEIVKQEKKIYTEKEGLATPAGNLEFELFYLCYEKG